jgi:UDP-glucose:(heptosyl)LPS alpha-1,3-glucosyltransferase
MQERRESVKIALVILHADPARGGAERYTVDLAVALAKRGHDVALLASSFAEGLQMPGVRRVVMRVKSFTRVGRYHQFLDSLDEHLAGEKYDIVHAMLPVRACDAYHPHAGLALAQARRTGLRMIFAPRRWAMARVERQLLAGDGKRSPPVVLSLSEYVKAEIVRHYPQLPTDRLATLFNAVDLEKFNPAVAPTGVVRASLDRDRVIGLFIGRDFKRKGLETAVEALGKFEQDGPVLAVVGRADFASYSITAPAQASIVALAAAGDPRPFYADADFFVLPTHHDPCSLVVLEALAMGVPVISTRFNGATEIMTDGVHGFVLSDPSDVDALAEAMRKMLDPERRAAMRQACRELRPRLSYEQHLERLEAIYQAAKSGK